MIIGGHSHSLLLKDGTRGLNEEDVEEGVEQVIVSGPYPTEVTNLDGKTTHIVQAYRYGQYAGLVRLEYDQDENLTSLNGDPILLNRDIPLHRETALLIDGWRESFKWALEKSYGTLKKDLPFSLCRYEECALGNLVSDAIQWFFKADIALTNSGGLRAGLSAGNVTLGDAMGVLPFPNNLVMFPISGQELQQMLENIVAARRPDGKKVISIGHWSGLKYLYDSARPEFQRIVSASVFDGALKRYEAIQKDRLYNLVTTDFVANGGDNLLVKSRESYQYSFGPVIVDAFLGYIEHKQIVDPGIEGRIEVIKHQKKDKRKRV